MIPMQILAKDPETQTEEKKLFLRDILIIYME